MFRPQPLAPIRSCWIALLMAVGLMGPVALAAADESAKPIAGIGPLGPAVEIQGTFKFTEGPAADSLGVVYFTDVPNSKVFRVEPGGKSSLFREDTHHANGQMFNAAGELVCCEMDGRVVAVSADGKQVRVLADEFGGKPFNSPNDLVIDRTGGVYFTDPTFGVVAQSKQGVSGVYYVPPSGQVSRLIDDVVTPNGVILSPDESTLYVMPTLRADMMAFPVTAPGKLGPGRVFCTLKQAENRRGGGGDGCTIDVRGNVYITSAIGVQVFSPEGKLLGVIEVPKQPSNAAFGGPDMKTLYVTARTSVYALPMEIAGHRFPAGAAAK